MTKPKGDHRPSAPDPYRWTALAFLTLFAVTVPTTFAYLLVIHAAPAGAGRPAPVAASAIVQEMGGVDELVKSDLFAQGRDQFAASCIACHGPEGQAKPGLGKAIAGSEFVAGLTDDELLAFIKRGRDPGDPFNTTGVGMPPKGGDPSLNDERIGHIIAYIRGLEAIKRGEVSGGAVASTR